MRKIRAGFWLAVLVGVFLVLACNLPTRVGSYGPTQTPPGPPSPSKLGTADLDVVYCTMDGVDIKMDVYYPESAQKAVPVVVYIHGGGWRAGDKTENIGMQHFTGFLANGYMVVSINYRLMPDVLFPAPIEDVMCATRHLRANAHVYGLDPWRIGVMGASAGGHLAAMLGVLDANDGFGKTGPYQKVSSRVQAVVMLAGPSNLKVLAVHPEFANLFIEDEGWRRDLDWISPINYVTADDPPFLLLHGDKDDIVPLSQSTDFKELLTSKGVWARLIVVKNGGHAFNPVGGAMNPDQDELLEYLLLFFDEFVKK
jgi:acetyl esterase/lipase